MKRGIRQTCIMAALVACTGAALAAPPARTPWGDPDLGGFWDSGTLTPLERPASMADREHLTEEEAAAIRGTGVEQIVAAVAGTAEGILTGELNDVWLAPGEDVVRSLRTSLVIDPADGRIPFTPKGRQRRMASMLLRVPTAPADGPEVRHLMDRCLLVGYLYEPNPFYLNHHKILQTRDHVVITSELLFETRIIPLDGRGATIFDPELPRRSGSSHGHWEGETLVVETSGFTGDGYYFGATAEGLEVVERFTRVDDGTIDYVATFADPASFTRPWTIENTLRSMDGPLYEYACHEGNYALGGILRGARLAEREAAAADSPPSP